MVGLGLLALALRLWLVLSAGSPPTSTLSDPSVYHALAVGLARGKGFVGVLGHPTAQFPPAFPFLLSLVYRVFGPHPGAGGVMNAILGSLTVPLLYFAARKTLGRVEAIVVGLGMTLLLGQILWVDLLLSETLFTFLLAVLLALLVGLDPDRRRSAVLLGLVIGLATLTRGEGLLLVTLAIAMWRTRLPPGRLRQQAAIMLAVAIACVVPWTIRNAYAMHSFVPLSTNLGATLWAGHNPQAYGGPIVPSERLLDQVHGAPGTPRREVAENTFLRNKALSWAVSHPVDELALIPEKLSSLFSGDGQIIYYWLNPSGQKPVFSQNAQYRLNVLANAETYLLLFAFVASLFVFGKALGRRRPILWGALVFLAISAVLYGFVFFGGFRYLAPLEPLMLFVAAPLIVQLGKLRAQRLDHAQGNSVG
jgi:4-amino-4-deoxy-L-arabinose transferase-like glycosyltransferase